MTQDLAGTFRSAVVGGGLPTTADRLSTLEDEHRLLCERRRRLHENIDMLEGLGSVKPDAAARLVRYKATETEISRRRRDLYLEIADLRVDGRLHQHSA